MEIEKSQIITMRVRGRPTDRYREKKDTEADSKQTQRKKMTE